MRQRNRHARQSATHPQIEMVKRARVHLHQHFGGPRFGLGRFGISQDLGSAVVLEEDGFHEILLKRAKRYGSYQVGRVQHLSGGVSKKEKTPVRRPVTTTARRYRNRMLR